jgi:hypothetical protein
MTTDVIEREIVWSDLARDLVYSTLPQTRNHKVTVDSILTDYCLELSELHEVCHKGFFRKLLDKELNRAGELGSRAGYVYRTEDMVSVLAERLFHMLQDAPLPELIRGFGVLARTAGMDALPEAKAAAASTMNVQINVPHLANPKLRHLEAGTDGV